MVLVGSLGIPLCRNVLAHLRSREDDQLVPGIPPGSGKVGFGRCPQGAWIPCELGKVNPCASGCGALT